MDHRSTLIRNVEIPSTLPPMDTLTNLTGSIIIKDVTTDNDSIRIEGDLLWRGYFEEGGGECLWEGAEYFSENIHSNAIHRADPPLIEPTILSLDGEALSESTFRLTFDIRWFEDNSSSAKNKNDETIIDVEPVKTRTEPTNPKEQAERKDPQTDSKQEAASCPCHKAKDKEESKLREEIKNTNREIFAPEEIKVSPDFEEKLESIDETWRETLKTINESPAETATPNQSKADTKSTAAEREEESEETEIKCCPYSKYCLRYYRTQEGDELEQIAEKFSATVAKLKECNHLEESVMPSGRLLRIP